MTMFEMSKLFYDLSGLDYMILLKLVMQNFQIITATSNLNYIAENVDVQNSPLFSQQLIKLERLKLAGLPAVLLQMVTHLPPMQPSCKHIARTDLTYRMHETRQFYYWHRYMWIACTVLVCDISLRFSSSKAFSGSQSASTVGGS